MIKIENEQRNWILFIAILILSIAGLIFLARYSVEQSSVDEIEEPITVTLIITTSDWTIEYENISTINNTVYKILLECANNYNFSVEITDEYEKLYNSIFVKSINGSENRENNRNQWWQYYVNGEYGIVGCDLKELFEGDLIEWKYEESKQ